MTLNDALHSAIFRTGKTQRAIALMARIPEAHLSAIIRGRAEASAGERKRLAGVLGKTAEELFPASETVND